jgi:UDP-hydrolysing UDP-N-acetyl-D-glucosamine 2-epimerase
MRLIKADPDLELQILVSGAHLEAEFGETWREIERDGFQIDARIDMQLKGDEPVALAKSMSLCLSGCAEVLNRSRPDMLVLLGDRYETLAAAQAAMMLRLPIAHVHGGEVTEGAIDDAVRHAITKMAHLHFAATEEYRQRIIQLGEQPARVFRVGAPGLDNIANVIPLSAQDLEAQLGIRFGKQNFLVTYHPVTLDRAEPAAAVGQLLDALDRFPDTHIVITKSNADAGGRGVNRRLDAYAAANRGRVWAISSLGTQSYLSVMALADAVVGNSSSGIIEAPAVGKPTVNIGSRQRGRVRAPAVIDCAEDRDAIVAAIERALSPQMKATAARRNSPYGTGGASENIKKVLAAVDLENLLEKKFYSLPLASASASRIA